MASLSFTEDFTAISLSATTGSWQTCSAAFAPANAVACVLLLHNYDGSGIMMGVRVVGSSLDRRFDIHEQEAGGYCSIVMHVQCDPNGKAQFYRETTDVIAYCLGYYGSGITYTEQFSGIFTDTTGTEEIL